MEQKSTFRFVQKIMSAPFASTILVCFLAALVLLVIAFCAARYEALAEAGSRIIFIFNPIIIGLVMAFLMNPIMTVIERAFQKFFQKRNLVKKNTFKRIRLASMLLALAIFLSLIAGFFILVIPQLVSTINYLMDNLYNQICEIIDWANAVTGGQFEDFLMTGKEQQNIDNTMNLAINGLREYLNLTGEEMVATLTQLGINVGRGFANFMIGIFISSYTLLSKEHFKAQVKKITYGIFPTAAANVILDIERKTYEIFYGFFIGKIIDSIIIGIICYFGMLLFQFPYPVLSSFIIGAANIIPIFGPIIGGIPTVTLIFITNPVQGIYFVVFVLVLQQLDGNLIGPKILGTSTGIPAFWVIVAIVVGGGTMGFIGMVIGVPIIALIYYLVGRIMSYLVNKRGLPVETYRYEKVGHIDLGTKEMIEKSPIETKRQTAVFKKFFKQKDNETQR